VRPVPAGQPVPEMKMPKEFLKDGAKVMPRTPGMDVTGPVPVTPPKEAIPYEQLLESLKPSTQTQQPAFAPTPAMPNPPPAQAPAAPAAPAPAKPGGGAGR